MPASAERFDMLMSVNTSRESSHFDRMVEILFEGEAAGLRGNAYY